MNELDVIVRQTPGVIECNFDEIKEALVLQMTAYSSLEVTEENIPESKKDLATLRKIRKAVDDRRKEIKKTFNEPYDEFEKKVKEILGVIDEPIALIDDKLKGFEEKRIKERQAHLHELYEQNIGDLSEYLPFERVKTPQWDNKTCADTSILSDISAARQKVKQDFDVIHALQSDIENELFEAYRASGNDLSAAIKKNTSYIEAKQIAERRIAEEEKRREEERRQFEAVEHAPILAIRNDVTFTVSAYDADQVEAILQFNDIEYVRNEV